MHYIFGIFKPLQINHVCERFRPHGIPEDVRKQPNTDRDLNADRNSRKELWSNDLFDALNQDM